VCARAARTDLDRRASQVNDEIWTALTFVLGITLRLLAIRYKWEMPKFVLGTDEKSGGDKN
jgi:uncharacterized membrane protein YeiH